MRSNPLRASRVPDVVEHLLERLPTVVGADVSVELGSATSTTKKQRLVIGGADGRQWMHTPRVKREEQALLGTVETTLPGKDTRAAMLAAYDIVDAVEQWMRRDPETSLRLGGTVCWGHLEVAKAAFGAGDTARSCVLGVLVHFTVNDI